MKVWSAIYFRKIYLLKLIFYFRVAEGSNYETGVGQISQPLPPLDELFRNPTSLK